MRKLCLTLALVGLLAVPVVAQFRVGMGRGSGELLLNKSVQAELKLTDSQKKDLGEVQKKGQEVMRKVFEAFKDGDKEKAMEIGKKNREELAKEVKKVRDGLSSDQKKRLGQIEVQMAIKATNPEVFTREDVAKELKLTEKQKGAVKEAVTEMQKDVKEVMEEAGKGKFREAFTKVQKVRKETFEKLNKELTSDQQKALKEMQGEAFEYKSDFGGFRPGGGRPGAKKKKSDL